MLINMNMVSYISKNNNEIVLKMLDDPNFELER